MLITSECTEHVWLCCSLPGVAAGYTVIAAVCGPAAAEVLSSLAFPPSSRFAIEKAQVEATARLGTAQNDSVEATAAAVAAAAVAAAVAANDPAQQDGSAAGDGQDPNIGYNSRGEYPVSNLSPWTLGRT